MSFGEVTLNEKPAGIDEYGRQKKGPVTLSNGDTYTGQWLNDKREGFGTLIKANGDQLEGTWKDDQLSGQGIRQAGGDVYRGMFVNGLAHG
jgi:hypothetical protein